MMKLFFDFKVIDKSVKNYKYGSSSVGRTLHLGCRGRRFESCLPYEIMGVRRRWRDGLDCKSSALAEQVRILQLPQNAGLERILATQRYSN